jgi:glycosyltransferase involved in cell wall biosynthesis
MDQRIEPSYVIVSPVKDEEKYVETTISAVIRQTVKPLRWIIVDDGSRDGTGEILRRYSERFPWIEVLRLERDSKRRLGIAEIRAFDCGYRLVENLTHDFVVKLDCDLDLPEDYFEKLIARFREDDRLGIASGIHLEKNGRGWIRGRDPRYHAVGASKMLRSECYRQIGGFVLRPGWDALDEIRAWAMGWKTCHFDDLPFYHLKPEGAATGYLTTNLRYGETDYVIGSGGPFFLLKAIHRMIVGKPILLGGLALVAGFLKAFLLRKPKLASAHEAKLYRQLLNRRMLEGIKEIGTKLRESVSGNS